MRLAGLDTEQDLVRVGVVAMEIMAIVGGDQREADLAADLAQALVERPVQLVVLQFEIEAPGEGPRVPFGRLAALVDAVGAQRPRDFAGQASGEHNQALGHFGENLLVDARLVVEPFFVGRGQQAAEIAVADAVLREQDQMEVAAAVEIVAALAICVRSVRLPGAR